MEYLTTFALLLLMFALCVSWSKTRRHQNWPPGPPTIPFIGNLNVDLTDMVAEFRKLRKQYGDVFSLILGSQTVVVVNGLDKMKEIFVKHGDVTSDRPDMFWFKEVTKYMGFGSSGKLWRTHRTFAVSTLRDLGSRTESFQDKIHEEVGEFVESVQRTKGKTFDISDLIHIVTANVICSVIFGHRYNHEDENIKKLLKLLADVLNNSKTSVLLTFFPFLKYIPGDHVGYKHFMKGSDKLLEHLKSMIEEQRTRADKNVVTNYVDAYLIQQANKGSDSSFTDDQLLYSIDDLFVAGSGSTHGTMKWLILALLHKPDIQQRMRKEILDVVGDSRLPSYTERKNLPYCDAVVHEAIRFGNVIPNSIPHSLSEDLYLNDYMIPKHAYLVPCLDSIAKDPELFPDPHEFKPTRFLTEDGSLAGTENVLFGAFGVGRRYCMGESIARMEIYLLSTALVQKFQLFPGEEKTLPSLSDCIVGITKSPLSFTLKAVEYT